MFAKMGLATKYFIITVLGYQLLFNCGVCNIQDCKAKLDMVIIVDSSLSVGLANYKTVKTFIASLIGHLPVQSDRIRVGLIRYASRTDVISYLDKDVNQTEKAAAVTSMAYRVGSTYTHSALIQARKAVLVPERGDRPDVPDLVILITDGLSKNESWTTQEAVALKRNANLKIFVIGIGKEVADRELISVATRPEMVYKLTDFSQLTEILENLARFSCSDMKEDSISKLKTSLSLPGSEVSSTSKVQSPLQPTPAASSTPRSTVSTRTLTSTSVPLTTTMLPATSHSTNSFRSPTFLSTLNFLTNKPTLTSREFDTTDNNKTTLTSREFDTTDNNKTTLTSREFDTTDNNKTTLTSREFDTTDNTVFLSTTHEQTPIIKEDHGNSSPTTQARLEIIPLGHISTSERESQTESTLEQTTITEMSTLVDAKTTFETETQSSTHLLTKDTSYSSSTDESTDSTARTNHPTTLFQSARNETHDFDGARTILSSVQYNSTRTTSTSVTTTTESILNSSDVTQSNKPYVTNFTQLFSATNGTSDTLVSQKSVTTTPSLTTQSTPVGIPTKTSTIGHASSFLAIESTSVRTPTKTSTISKTSPSFLDNQQITTNKKTHQHNTLTSTTAIAKPKKISTSMSSQSSTGDSQTSYSHRTTGVQQSIRKSKSRASTAIPQTSVDTSRAEFPQTVISTEPPSKHYQTTDSQTTFDMKDVKASAPPTQINTVLAENEAFVEQENTTSINNTTIDYIHGQTGGDLSSRDVYIFIAGGTTTAIVLVAMGTFLSVLCRRRNSSRNLDAKS